MRIRPLEIQRVYFFRIKYIAYNRKKSFLIIEIIEGELKWK